MQIKVHKQFTKCFSHFNSQMQGLILKTILGIKNETGSAGLRMHKVGVYYSYSVTMSIRLLTLLDKDVVLLVYVGEHDETYNWGAKNHPLVADNMIVGFVSDDDLSVGVPISFDKPTQYDYLKDYGFDKKFIYYISTLNDDELLNAIDYIAPEYQELILFGKPMGDNNTIECSDIIVVNNDQELQHALALSVENWCLFLHPKQKYIVEYPHTKNLMIKGGPGTGKTVVIIHRFVKAIHLFIDQPPIFLCYNLTTKNIIIEMLKKLSIKNFDNIVIFDDFKQDASGKELEKFLGKYSEIFIDEAQDMPIYFTSRLLYLIESGKTIPPVTMAYDLNQSMFSSIGEAIHRLSKYSDIINLDYCYRSTLQIINAAVGILDNGDNLILPKDFKEEHTLKMSKDFDTRKMVCALSGENVIKKIIYSFSNLLNEVERFTTTEQLQFTSSDWAIIFSGKKEFELKRNFEKNIKHAKNIFITSEVKGREFFKGIVISTNDGEVGRTANSYKKNIISDYVALTRFRSKVLFLMYKGEI